MGPGGLLGKVSDGVDSHAHLFYMFDENSGGLLECGGVDRHAHLSVAHPGFDDGPTGLLDSGGVDCHGVLVDAEDVEVGMQKMVGVTTGFVSSDAVLPVAAIVGCRMMVAKEEGPGT